MKNNTVCEKTIKDAIVSYMNPYHVKYIKEYPYNSIYKLFQSLDSLEEEKLYEIMGIAGSFYIKGINKTLFNDKDKLFTQVKSKCIEIAKTTSELVAINAFVSVVANGLLCVGNPLNVNEKIIENKNMLENMKYNEKEIIGKVKQTNGNKTISDDNIKHVYNMFQESIDKMKINQEKNLDLYNYFCNNVIKDLLNENYLQTKKELQDD
ncbi:hypothetical protein [Clostridium rectalis]|uniref:hypothetical protein n=1 Tax=Clostridium rectalis TaxID=2040295 RepID=UPI000F63B6AC|nr:hypothetical protein [Clostridium rectalis]